MAQVKVLVSFTDKDGVHFEPTEYFHQKAIDRRIKHGLPLTHFTDLPVRKDYLKMISNELDSVKVASRWMNGVVGWCQIEDVQKLSNLEYVSQVIIIASEAIVLGKPKNDSVLTQADIRLMKGQIARFNPQSFTANNINGDGVIVAIFDVGFKNVDVNDAFKTIRDGDRILKTFDFAKKKEFVYHHDYHGTMVLSCIAGNDGENISGLAQGAKFLLARTEQKLIEPFSEEENWLAAAEWADKNGADIINSSLGYGHNRYFPQEMTGKFSLVSEAARIATRKGMLVVNAAGNEGDINWNTLITPADVDSVLTVGGIEPWTGIHEPFSSYGSSAQESHKPNVVSYAHVIASGKEQWGRTQGTSFASPLVAGYAACVLQLHPEWTNMKLKEEIERSGDLYPYWDYSHGYGVPNAAYFNGNNREPEPTFDFVKAGKDTFHIRIRSSHVPVCDFAGLPESYEATVTYYVDELDNYSPGNLKDWTQKRDVMYVKHSFEKGTSDFEYVIEPLSATPLTFTFTTLGASTVTIHYKGYTNSFRF